MKLAKTFALSLLILGMGVAVAAPVSNKAVIKFADIPVKTVVIKNPEAADANKYFSTATTVTFWVYKAGSADDANKIAQHLKKNSDVANCGAGKLTGDYQEMTVTLKTAKDKAFWASLFKSAGLGHIKINNNEIVEMDKM
jgi:hypothetical protein